MTGIKKVKTEIEKYLESLLKAPAKHELTPGEIWDQRVSFAYGQLMHSAPHITKENVKEVATKAFGPRPID